MPTLVVNIRYDKFDVYVGRGSKWGNQWSHLEGTKARFKVATREEAIRLYGEWILTQPQLLAALPELKGKRLGCHCEPQPCHAYILADLADAIGEPK